MMRPMNTSVGYAYLDVETTGFSETSDRVVQIGLVHLAEDLTYEESWVTLVNPRLRWVGAFHVHGLTAAMLVNAPTFAEVWPKLRQRLAGRTVAAHNLPFDARMINAEVARIGGRPLINVDEGVDTYALSKALLPTLPNRKLGTVCRELGVPLTAAHDALADAMAGASVLRELVGRRAALAEPREHTAVTAGLPVRAWLTAVQQQSVGLVQC